MKKHLYLYWFLASILLATIFAGCDDSTIGPAPNVIEDSYAQWKKLGIDSYTITQQKMCFCVDGGTKVIVQVKGNVIIGVTDSTTAKPIPQERWQWYKTIDQLFDTALSVRDSEPDKLDIHFDEIYRFPKYIWVDPSSQIADEEYGFSITSFNPQK